jgi:outer membrane protein assembly factor BamB
MLRRLFWCLAPLALASLVPAAAPLPKPGAFDWPQWQGPERNAISRETGLLQDWPDKQGPPLAWKITGLGEGFSTTSVAGGRIFGQSLRGNDEVVWALDEKDGKGLWAAVIGPRTNVDHPGARGTPTVDGNRVYALSIGGDLVCLDVEKGQTVWAKNLIKDFKGQRGGWGYSESPLIDGDRLIVTPGGKMATLVCLNKKTGDVIWKGVVPKGDGAHYSSVIAVTFNGKRQYIQFLAGGVVGLSGDGEFLWRYDHPHNGTANCSTPIYADGHVFAASGYGTGGGLVKLIADGEKVRAEEVYFTRQMKNHHGGMVLVDGYLYGSDEGHLTCLDFKTGEVMWAEGKAGKGSIACADGRLYYRNEGKGEIILVEVNPKKYVEHGRFNQPQRSGQPAWPHPIIANGKLYIRDQDVLFCYDVKKH